MLQINEFNKLSLHSKDALLAAKEVSCFSCVNHVNPSDIVEWVDDGTTGICPDCHIDSLVPGVFDIPTLTAAKEMWFD